jgi:SAM-dependent methyltransferase
MALDGNFNSLNAIAGAYGAAADRYESDLAASFWIRHRLWSRMETLFRPGESVLDVTAGTGLDAAYLLSKGIQVVAMDISPGMLAKIGQKNINIELRVGDFSNAAQVFEDRLFDGVISTFAGLNTSSDLARFAAGIETILKPDGKVLIHCLNRWPILDLVHQLARFRLQEIWRQCVRGERLIVIGDMGVKHFYYTPAFVYHRWFMSRFILLGSEGYGVFQPAIGHAGGKIGTLEARTSRYFPFNHAGTFFSLEMRLRDPHHW